MSGDKAIRARKSYRVWSREYARLKVLGLTHAQASASLNGTYRIIDAMYGFGYTRTAAQSRESLDLMIQDMSAADRIPVFQV